MHWVHRLDHTWRLLRLCPGCVSVTSCPSVGLPLTGMHPCMAQDPWSNTCTLEDTNSPTPMHRYVLSKSLCGVFSCFFFFNVSIYFFLFILSHIFLMMNVWACPCFCSWLFVVVVVPFFYCLYLPPSCSPPLSCTVFFTVLSVHLSLALSQFGNRA